VFIFTQNKGKIKMARYSKIVCLSGDTKIRTDAGEFSIADVKTGTNVLTYNFYNKKLTYSKVSRFVKSFHSFSAKIYFGNTILHQTLDHPIYICGKGWCSVKPAVTLANYKLQTRPLECNDICISYNSDNKLTQTIILDISLYKCNKYFYCIGVSSNNFFANGILVHDENVMKLDLNNKFIHFEDLVSRQYRNAM
jgi:hypothetical protein